MKDENKYSAHIKILVLGESGVGKTSLLLRYCEDDYSNNHLPTIGVDFKIKSISIKDKKYKLQIYLGNKV
jgi:GTPase SAR1 family protein